MTTEAERLKIALDIQTLEELKNRVSVKQLEELKNNFKIPLDYGKCTEYNKIMVRK